ncbi:MAG TPA: hypothetical protein VFY39_17930, partial [Gammaproteobacteria bacterium]|nr:hypothetical protein [Gammaproteobacteria bacterium]
MKLKPLPSISPRFRRLGLLAVLPLLLPLLGADPTLPKPFRQYPGVEYYNFPLPSDYKQPGEWVFARLMYPSVTSVYDRGWSGDWTQG